MSILRKLFKTYFISKLSNIVMFQISGFVLPKDPAILALSESEVFKNIEAYKIVHIDLVKKLQSIALSAVSTKLYVALCILRPCSPLLYMRCVGVVDPGVDNWLEDVVERVRFIC